MSKFKLIITILLSILLLIGSQAKENLVQEATIVQEKTEEKNKISIVNNGDYAKAYAEALARGLIIPTEEADDLIRRYEAQIEYEPRLIKDTNEEWHIIWTNKKLYLVIDGQDTKIEVSECVYPEAYPELPRLEVLEEFHNARKEAQYGIAETAFLNNLVIQLKEKQLYKEGLYWARFYNCDGKAVVVYSLEENGELYINTQKIKKVRNKE